MGFFCRCRMFSGEGGSADDYSSRRRREEQRKPDAAQQKSSLFEKRWKTDKQTKTKIRTSTQSSTIFSSHIVALFEQLECCSFIVAISELTLEFVDRRNCAISLWLEKSIRVGCKPSGHLKSDDKWYVKAARDLSSRAIPTGCNNFHGRRFHRGRARGCSCGASENARQVSRLPFYTHNHMQKSVRARAPPAHMSLALSPQACSLSQQWAPSRVPLAPLFRGQKCSVFFFASDRRRVRTAVANARRETWARQTFARIISMPLRRINQSAFAKQSFPPLFLCKSGSCEESRMRVTMRRGKNRGGPAFPFVLVLVSFRVLFARPAVSRCKNGPIF